MIVGCGKRKMEFYEISVDLPGSVRVNGEINFFKIIIIINFIVFTFIVCIETKKLI